MPDLAFSPVKTEAEIAAVAELAQEILTAHFPPLIGPAQTAYMIETFQSAKALHR